MSPLRQSLKLKRQSECNKSVSVVTHKLIVKYCWGIDFMRNDCAMLQRAGFNNFTYAMEKSPSSEANRFSRNSSHFMETGGSLLHLQVAATCPCPAPCRSSPCPPPHFLKIHLRLGIRSGLFPSGVPTKILYAPLLSPIRATCTAFHSSRFDSPNNNW